jgi:hypothetical protein
MLIKHYLYSKTANYIDWRLESREKREEMVNGE